MSNEEKALDIRFHSGYCGDEKPRAVIIGANEYPIQEILDTKRIQNSLTGERSEIFICRLSSPIRDMCCNIEIRIFKEHRFEIKFLD